jgi:hypothetical protein
MTITLWSRRARSPISPCSNSPSVRNTARAAMQIFSVYLPSRMYVYADYFPFVYSHGIVAEGKLRRQGGFSGGTFNTIGPVQTTRELSAPEEANASDEAYTFQFEF